MARLTAQVPKDLNAVEAKLFFGLTRRQLIWSLIGGAVGAGAYFALKGLLSTTASAIVVMIFAFPFLLIGIFKNEGMTVEEIVKYFFVSQCRRNPIRAYREKDLLTSRVSKPGATKTANHKARSKRNAKKAK